MVASCPQPSDTSWRVQIGARDTELLMAYATVSGISLPELLVRAATHCRKHRIRLMPDEIAAYMLDEVAA
jgi:hypothetical protein